MTLAATVISYLGTAPGAPFDLFPSAVYLTQCLSLDSMTRRKIFSWSLPCRGTLTILHLMKLPVPTPIRLISPFVLHNQVE